MRRRLVSLLAVMLFATLMSHVSAAPGLLQAHFIDVGQSDSCWLRFPNGDDVLVDGSKPQAGPTAVAYLQANGVTDVELLVATHGDSDHIGGLLDVLRSMPVRVALLDSQDCTTVTC